MEVRFTAKEAVQKHQGSALSLPIKDVVGQVDRTEEAGKEKNIHVY